MPLAGDACTAGSGLPLPVSALTTGAVTTSWSTTQPGTGAYDVAYDIWFSRTPAMSGSPDGAELMIWLNHHGRVQPFGSQVGTARQRPRCRRPVAGDLLGVVPDREPLARRLPGPGHADQHQRIAAQRLETRLHVPRRPEDHQPVERHGRQSGAKVSVTSQSYNGSLAPGRSATAGFTGRSASSDARPAAFTLDGTACRS